VPTCLGPKKSGSEIANYAVRTILCRVKGKNYTHLEPEEQLLPIFVIARTHTLVLWACKKLKWSVSSWLSATIDGKTFPVTVKSAINIGGMTFIKANLLRSFIIWGKQGKWYLEKKDNMNWL